MLFIYYSKITNIIDIFIRNDYFFKNGCRDKSGIHKQKMKGCS